MKLSLGCDHGGYLLKEELKSYLIKNGHEVIDVGTNSLESCNYPIFAREAAELVAKKECELGIVVCTSGEGVMMTANKVKGVRCGLAYNNEVCALMREHNDANMISIGAKYTPLETAIEYINIFLSSEFEGGRHQRRVDQIMAIEAGTFEV